MPSKIVLITGCSTGIGQDLARRLTAADYTVIATARRPETLADLPAALTLPLDVTDSPPSPAPRQKLSAALGVLMSSSITPDMPCAGRSKKSRLNKCMRCLM
jgi:NADP-dependent 3-hydroxy acid dehydrogenase YdfG